MTGDEPNNRKMELIDSTTNKSKVLQYKYESKSFGNIGVRMATGKVVLNHVLICGGYPFSKFCYKLGRECQWTQFANMSKVRIGAASIVRKDQNGVRILKLMLAHILHPETLQRPLNQALYVLQTYFRISL